MIVKNNYNECLTNLACSIRKYFELDYKHNTLDYIDKLLEEYNPKNVVVLLCDGMGSNIMDRILSKDSFLIKNRLKAITTVFPATTVAATTSITTGLNPVESGMLGWDSYYKDLDNVYATFLGYKKGSVEGDLPDPEANKYNEEHMKTKTIAEYINEAGKYKGYNLMPFGQDPYLDIYDMDERIIELCKSDGKKFIYAYDEDPDHTMHRLGWEDPEVQKIFHTINERVEKLSKLVKDTVFIVVADHGHTNVENILLEDYPDVVDCFKRTTSMEPRATNFFIKEDKKYEFKELFNKYFGNYYDLYSIDEVIESKLFGDGEENPIYRDLLGDFLAIAKTEKTLIYGNQMFKSHHAGYTEDEIMIPLIVFKTEKE